MPRLALHKATGHHWDHCAKLITAGNLSEAGSVASSSVHDQHHLSQNGSVTLTLTSWSMHQSALLCAVVLSCTAGPASST